MRFGAGFYFALAWQGLLGFRPERLAWRAEFLGKHGGPDDANVRGLQNLPRGRVQLISNHGGSGQTLCILAALLRALQIRCPKAVRRIRVVSGPPWNPEQRKKRGKARASAALAFRHIVWTSLRGITRRIISLAGTPGEQSKGRGSIAALRRWWNALRRFPVLVFPEGRASQTYCGCRPGAGMWLESVTRDSAGERIPTVPVVAWYEDGRWLVNIGKSISWTTKKGLLDLQVDLALADLLPETLAPDFQALLARWREVHETAI